MRDHDDGGEWSALEGALPLCSPQVRALSTQPYPHSPTQFPSLSGDRIRAARPRARYVAVGYSESR
jgi:hypothetical protein